MTVSKAFILSEIQRTAKENGGKPLGRLRFATETGIRAPDWEHYWPRWSDAVREAGLEPNLRQERYPDEALLSPLVAEIRELGRVPTTRELRILRKKNPDLPSSDVYYRRYGSRRSLAGHVAEYSRGRPELADVLATVESFIESEPALSSEEVVTTESDTIGFVYLLRSGRFHKVGRTNAIGRREYELAIQLPERATLVHQIRTDDPSGIEAYWHRRFADRRKGGEWFALTPADVQAFKRRKFM